MSTEKKADREMTSGNADVLRSEIGCTSLMIPINFGLLGATGIGGLTGGCVMGVDPIPHRVILDRLLDIIKPIDFRAKAGLSDGESLTQRHYRIITIESLLELAQQYQWGLCRHHNFIYVYNGAFWNLVETDQLVNFLGLVSEKMGIDRYLARDYQFRNHLLKQFITLANLPHPEQPQNLILINLKNGTLEISMNGVHLRNFDREDFLKYQLPFEYNPYAEAPMFRKYLEKVLPDRELQMVLSEYLGYVFIPNTALKLEKALLLYGTGANGKSVCFDVVNALYGPENTSNYTLQSLTDIKGYHRAMIANKLINYASDINGNLDSAMFKLLASGEPMEARLPYGNPMIISQYAKLMFNCNELFRDVEHTHAFHRRLMIIPFEVTIPDHEQDVELANKIIASELSGVFNWVLEGLYRLLEQKNFTRSKIVTDAGENFKKQSDSVRVFLEECNYKAHVSNYVPIKDLYQEYRSFCQEDGFKAVKKTTFKIRLEAIGMMTNRLNNGNVCYVKKVIVYGI